MLLVNTQVGFARRFAGEDMTLGRAIYCRARTIHRTTFKGTALSCSTMVGIYSLHIRHALTLQCQGRGTSPASERAVSSKQHWRSLLDCSIARIALENPVSIISSQIRRPDQIIQPWQFGHGETKATCLWLKGLPALKATNIVAGREQRVHRMPPSPDRWKERSRTYQGVADAMAGQWG